MKRLLSYNGRVAGGFVAFWILLFALDGVFKSLEFLRYFLFASYALVFFAFWMASWLALRHTSKHPIGIATLISVLASPLFTAVVILVLVNVSFAILGD
jgi:hypothetical protein